MKRLRILLEDKTDYKLQGRINVNDRKMQIAMTLQYKDHVSHT